MQNTTRVIDGQDITIIMSTMIDAGEDYGIAIEFFLKKGNEDNFFISTTGGNPFSGGSSMKEWKLSKKMTREILDHIESSYRDGMKGDSE